MTVNKPLAGSLAQRVDGVTFRKVELVPQLQVQAPPALSPCQAGVIPCGQGPRRHFEAEGEDEVKVRDKAEVEVLLLLLERLEART